MKADITSKGHLIVYPENDLELYALRQWWDNFEKGKGESVLEFDIEPKEDKK